MADSPRGVDHVDSMDSHDANPKQPEKQKSRRPPNTAFRQQRLKAWQPILTPKTVLPLFFTIGIIFAPIGGLLLYASAEVREVKLEYTNCGRDAPLYNGGDGFEDMPPSAVSMTFKSNNATSAQWAREPNVEVDLAPYGGRVNTSLCHLRFTTPEDMSPPVLFYYHLTNFYQNHRRYVDSFDADQLKGNARSYGALDGSDCDPLAGNSSLQLPYYPCGLIANSLFNDSFSSPVEQNPRGSDNDEPRVYLMENNTDIAWSSDAELYGDGTDYTPDQVVPPPNWIERYPDGYTDDTPPPNLRQWQAFQVWMRTAGLPTFSKLYQRNDTRAMESGTYEIIVQDRFNVTAYDGTKSVLISTRTVMGGRNPFLGIAYVVVGGICIVLGVVFTVTHLFKPRKLGDHTYLSWNNTPASKSAPGPSTGMATGRDIRPGEA